jgi:beta-lactamase superfamily II metal-dependent hydrolase
MAIKGSKKSKKKKNGITVRMYDVGFGDCFLVTIPTSDGNRRMLFDCGSVAKSKNPGVGDMDDVVKRLIADVTGPDGPRIDVVVCTHRHKDHIAGFSRAEWSDVEVGEVWMPWTESDEEEAIRIREAQMRLALALNEDLTFRASVAVSAQEKAAYTNALELVLNATGNENAMAMLHEGFKGGRDIPRRFLPEKDKSGNPVQTLKSDLLPGVTVHVLGPSRDERVIRDMDPPAGKSYMQLHGSMDSASDAPDPFNSDWWYEGEPFSVSATDKERIGAYSDGFSAAVAASLDSAVNGTSLMLIVQVGDTLLLFPGDAQWGTWEAALEHKKFRELLKRVRFYKIGHHGSHNATPVDFVEKTIGTNVISMASTRPMKNWPHIPMPGLITNLGTRGPLVRSDEPDQAGDVFMVGEGIIDTFLPL